VLARLRRGLETRSGRSRLYAATAFGFFLLALAGTRFGQEYNFIFSDGRGYYVYLPSAVIDGDLDFENQVREHYRTGWNPLTLSPRLRTGTGRVFNKFPIGLALSLAPAFLAAHGTSLALHAATGSAYVTPDGYSAVYQTLCLAAILAFGMLTFATSDRWLTERYSVPGPLAAAAVLSVWIGSHYAYYYFREPFMAHVVSAFWIAATAALSLRARERLDAGGPSALDLFLLALASSLAFVCRFSNAVLLFFVCDFLIEAWRRGAILRVARRLPLALLGLFPLALQAYAWFSNTGKALVDPYQTETFKYWLEPRLLRTLFSTHHGLFAWAPVLLLVPIGLALQWRRVPGGDPLRRGLVFCFVVVWYLNSSWYAWWFGEAFGARAFLELTPLFVLGTGFAFDAAARRGPGMLRVALGYVVACVVFEWLLMLAFTLYWIKRG
jgi:hypothetical protein